MWNLVVYLDYQHNLITFNYNIFYKIRLKHEFKSFCGEIRIIPAIVFEIKDNLIELQEVVRSKNSSY